MFTPSIVELGSLKTSWTNGYNGQKSFYVNNSVLVYQCGSSVKFCDTHTGKNETFTPECLNEDENTNGICLVTATTALNLFAYSDTKLSPCIYVHDYQGFREVSKLKDGAEIEYLSIEFSNGEAILSLSNIPNMEIIIWNWKSGQKISMIEVDPAMSLPEHISFSPINWRNLCVAYTNELYVWNIEQFNDLQVLTKKNRLYLPSVSTELVKGIFSEFKDEFSYSLNAITNLDDEKGEKIEHLLDEREKHTFQTLCWTNNPDEILIVTANNHIFKYSISQKTIRCIFEPELVDDGSDPRFRINSNFKILSLKFHRRVMLAICSDSCVRLLEGSDLISQKDSARQSIRVKSIVQLAANQFTNSSFNMQYTNLSVSSSNGVFTLDIPKLLEIRTQELVPYEHASNANLVRHAINFDEGKTVALAGLNPNGTIFVVLKETGSLQVWNIKQKRIINRVDLNQKCTSLSSHTNMPLAAVGTESGQIIFIDFSNENEPTIIEECSVHQKAVKLLKFNSCGTMLFSVGCDGKVFIIDTRLSDNVQEILVNIDQRLVTNNAKVKSFEKGFYILGYIEFEGEAVCFDLLDTMVKTEINTRVAIGVHDPDDWEIVKKVIDDVLPFSQTVDTGSKTPSGTKTPLTPKSGKAVDLSREETSDQDMLLGNVQFDASISRFNYRNTDRPVEYVEENSEQVAKLACKVLTFDVSTSMFKNVSKPLDLYSTIRLDFNNDTVCKTVYHSYYLFSDMVLANQTTLALATDRFISTFALKEYVPSKKTNMSTKFSYLELSNIVGSHDFGYTRLTRSTNNQFIVSGGYDGLVTIRKAGDLKSFIDKRAGHYVNGGIEHLLLTSNGLNLIAVGHDNSVMNLSWTCTFDQNTSLIGQAPISGDYNHKGLSEIVSYAQSPKGEDLTWFQIKEKQFFIEQDKQYLPIKKEIINGLDTIKKKLRELMEENAAREEQAKLKESEFYLDLDELDRLHKQTDRQIAEIRENTELANLAKLYVRGKIKKECWDKMAVKGRGIEAFNINLLVENYPLKERSREETALLERVQMLRKIEIGAQKMRNELCYDIMKKDNITELVDINHEEKEDTTNQQPNNYLSPNLNQLSFKGSIGALFGGDSTLLYSQFELFTVEQKWYQVILIQDLIYKIKANFNHEFEQIMQRKYQEIAKIKEKNQRLRQIYDDMSQECSIPEPRFGDAENPEVLFEVKDEEITVAKWLTSEQRKELEEREAELERKREAEKLDNWRERGLFDMMGGVLQIRREDELKKNIPVPSFASNPREEWTLEETRLYAAYELKCKELEEEREKLRKQLNAEIVKLNEQILECYQNFDNQLMNLHLRKVKTQQAVYQEELKVCRLFNHINVDMEMERHEAQLAEKLDKVRNAKKELTSEIGKLKKTVDEYREAYDIQQAEDKAQDKAFMREFSDVYPVSTREQLLKLFKKRAKVRMTAGKTIISPPIVFVPEYGQDNPFSDRPSTAQQIKIYDQDTDLYLADLDEPDNAPGVDAHIWERFVAHRRDKIKSENNLKVMGLNLSEMILFLQKRVEEEEATKKQCDNLNQELIEFQETRLNASHNLQVQLIMKQGQVEINPGVYVHNFSNCLLIHRDVVESLNKVIKHHGSQKIAIMVDCKDYKKGNRQLEWEHRKMKMTIEDFMQKQRDITYLKLSREIQTFLDDPNYDANKQREVAILEATIAFKNKQNEKIYSKKAKAIKDINKASVKVANTNDQFDDQLKETNVVLHDRKHIKEETIGMNVESIREEKFQQIIQRRKLVDLAKAQAQEVAFLRSEVERLRMKTFPALVQIEF